MKKKVKLFEDYYEEIEKINGPSRWYEDDLNKNNAALVTMLNDLATKVHKLEEENKLLDKDNDMLRGWITELQHKMDFFFKVFEINNMNLKDLYQKTLKQSK